MAPLALVTNFPTRMGQLQCHILAWIALLALSVSIELVSSSARVTSVLTGLGKIRADQFAAHPSPPSSPSHAPIPSATSAPILMLMELVDLGETCVCRKKRVHFYVSNSYQLGLLSELSYVEFTVQTF